VRLVRDTARSTSLTARLEALGRLVDCCAGRVADERLAPARTLLDRAEHRLGLSREHTVVAFAGASGTGKSSLFNAIVGIALSPVGVKRPTTVTTVACVWDPNGLDAARPLLDRISVPRRQQLVRQSALDRLPQDDLAGLVLLDLPDYDSAIRTHRAEVDRVVELADAVVWVTDPQKYADAVWHERYLRKLGHHADVQTVLLNQVDKLSDEDAAECVADLTTLLASDGLAEVEVIASSARTGVGLGRLRALLSELATARHSAVERLSADLDKVVEDLTEHCLGPESEAARRGVEPGVLTADARARLCVELERAAGLTVLGESVTDTYVRRAAAVTGWPVSQAWRSGRSRPADLLRLPKVARLAGEPAPAPLQRTIAEQAVTDLLQETVTGLPDTWANAVRGRADEITSGLVDALDATLASTAVGPETVPVWWTLAQICQWVLALAGLVGLSGMAVWLARAGHAGLPTWAGLPAPMWLLVGGVLGGVGLAALCRGLARRAAARLWSRVTARIKDRIAAAATGLVDEPIERELDAYRAMREQFAAVRRR
jgi:GTP-binding protein EngB required for normal cell division